MSRFNRSLRPLLDVIYNYDKYDLYFDGVDDVVVLGQPGSFPEFQINGTYTVEMIMKYAQTPANYEALWNAGTGTSNRHGCLLHSNGTLVFGYYDGSYTRISRPITPGEHHIACVNDQGSLTLYIDGEGGTGPGQSTVIGSPGGLGGLFRLGQNGLSGNHFKGILREVRLWNVARTAQEIQENMNKTLVGDEPGLVGLWLLTEGARTTAFDRSAHRNGQIIGASWTVKS